MFDAFFASRESIVRSGPFVEDAGSDAESYFGAISSYNLCAGCGRFHGVADGGEGGAQGVLVNADDRGGTNPNGKPSLLPGDAGAQITRSNLTWASGIGQPATVTWAFRGAAPSQMPTDTQGFSVFNASQIAGTLAALQSWSDVANITFNRVQDAGSEYSAANAATILFGNYSSGASGAAAFAYLPGSAGSTTAPLPSSVQGDVWINASLGYNATPVALQYGLQVLTHEIGHAIGLSHPAAYNAAPGVSITYAADAIYFEDSRQYSLMSYFSETLTGANYRVGNQQYYSAVPLLDDIAAAQRLYGANTTTRTGDTVYGFNSTADRSWFSATSSASVVIFAAWDAGGTDTFDFSGFTQNQVIDLRQGAFSSVGALIGNVAIAMGAVIENAVGGSGDDAIRGNSANNSIRGNDGADTIDGGLGTDTVVFSGNRSQYTISWNGQVGTVTGPDGTDTITNVEFLQFADQTIAAGATGGLTVAGDPTNDTMTGTAFADNLGGLGGNDTLDGLGGDDVLNGGTGNDTLNGGNDNDVLVGGLGVDFLNGGAGTDTADYRTASGGVTVNLTTGSASGAAGADTLSSIEDVQGSTFADVLTGDGNANVLRGNGGVDTLNGGGGADSLYAGAPAESAADDIVKAQGTANNSFLGAVTLNGGFDLQANANIRNATTVPHATVTATSHGAEEFYAFTVTAGDQIVIDIDGAGFDSVLRLYNPSQNLLVTNDDATGADVDGGNATDSAITYTATESGTFYISVSRWISGDGASLVTGAPPAGTTYTMHVSVPSATATPITLRGSTLNGDDGDDFLNGGSGADTLNGGLGADTLYASGGDDAMNGGDGIDWIDFAAGASVTVNLATGTATATGFGTDTLTGIENVRGGSGADTITGDGAANRIEGGLGADVISAGGGADTVVLSGFADAAQVTLGAGADVLALAAGAAIPATTGAVIVTDFATGAGGDRIDLSAWLGNLTGLASGANPFQTGHLRMVQDGANTRLQVDVDGGGDAFKTLVTFQNTTATNFTVDNLGYATTPSLFSAPVLTVQNFGSGPSAANWANQDTTPRFLADVNGDGRPDVVGFGGGGTYVSLTDAQGRPGAIQLGVAAFGSDAAAGGWTNMANQPRQLGDVNGDGRADVIGFGDEGTYVSLGQANGAFAAPVLAVRTFGFGPVGGGWGSQDNFPRFVADVNGDGRADVIGCGYDGTFVSLGQADGTFGAAFVAVRSYGRSDLGGGWQTQSRFGRTTGDVNGDGRADILAFGDAGVWVSLGRADGTFTDPSLEITTFGAGAPGGGWVSQDQYPRLIGDVNGDGRSDVVGFANAGAFVALGQADGGFGSPFLAINTFGYGPEGGGWTTQDIYTRLLADVNGDGRDDIIGFGSAQTYISLARADGTFGAVTAIGSNMSRSQGYDTQFVNPRFVADLNGDGLADLLGMGPNGVQVSIADAAAFAQLGAAPAAQVLPALPDAEADDKEAAPQTVPGLSEDSAPTKDDGAQVLPGAADEAASTKDAEAQVLPGAPADVDESKEAGPQILPGVSDDDFLTLVAPQPAREWAGLAARRGDFESAREPSVWHADDFLPLMEDADAGAGDQVVAADFGLDLNAMFQDSIDTALDQALATLARVNPPDPDVEVVWHTLPAHDAFQ